MTQRLGEQGRGESLGHGMHLQAELEEIASAGPIRALRLRRRLRAAEA